MAFIIDIYIRKLLLLEQIEQFGETHEWIIASVTKDTIIHDMINLSALSDRLNRLQ